MPDAAKQIEYARISAKVKVREDQERRVFQIITRIQAAQILNKPYPISLLDELEELYNALYRD